MTIVSQVERTRASSRSRLGTSPTSVCRPENASSDRPDTVGLGPEQLRERRIVLARPGTHLVPGAFARVLVRPEAQEARAVPDALVLHLVVADLADELRPHLVPRQIASRRPARS